MFNFVPLSNFRWSKSPRKLKVYSKDWGSSKKLLSSLMSVEVSPQFFSVSFFSFSLNQIDLISGP